MYKQKTILGLIPARGGSKGLPRKNIRPLLGKPLVGWTIIQALNSRYLDKVIVSTDDLEIARISRNFGAEVPFLRPKKFAVDTAKSIDVIKHALGYFRNKGIEFDYLALLEPTSPLRKKEDIDEAIKKLIDNQEKADSLISVGEAVFSHPIIMKRINSSGYVSNFIKNVWVPCRRQDLPAAYFPYGVIYLSKKSTLLKTRTFYQRKTLPYLIERWQNYEIDDFFDAVCIEAIAKLRKMELK